MYKKQNLFFEDFEKTFSNIVIEGLKNIEPKKLRKNFDEILSFSEEVFSKYEDTISTAYIDNHKFKIAEFMNVSHRSQVKIITENKESFTSFLLYINTCVSIYEKITDDLDKLDDELNNTLKLAISLYGLCVRRGQQITELLMSGFADAAMIMWRSLYENVITLLTIVINDSDELSKRYIDHSYRNSNRKVSSYQNNHFELRFPQLPEETIINLKKEKERLIQKYGKEFVRNDFGWADILFEKGRANLRLLEENIELNKYRTYYTLCSEQIHSSINSFDRFTVNGEIILPGLMKQDEDLDDLIDPMQFTVAVLDEINDYIIWEFSVETERNANMIFIRKLFEKLISSFKKDAEANSG